MKKEGRAKMCHRLAYEFKFGPIPEGMQALHKCDNPKCCNPDHIFIGTPMDNVADCIQKGRRRIPKGESHYMAKLSNLQVEEIRRMYPEFKKSRKTQTLADNFGISKGHVFSIVHYRRRA